MNQQLATLQAANTQGPLRIFQILFTVLALLSFALGSVLLSLVWFGVGMTTGGKDFGAAMEGRTVAFILLWPATMLAVWIFSTLALILAKRWLLASLSLPVAFALLYGVWIFITLFMLNISGVMFTALFILLNTGAIWLASWFLKKPAKSNT
ncbi:MAG TPA: hypothetical protein VHZ51_00060 [Ktedonobacteraceae bacterium]|nr:hypothetical protein [Ktedonobacteraceae bacterium]